MKKRIIIIMILTTLLTTILTSTISPIQQVKTSKAQTASEAISLPIVMYHSILKSRQSKYIITPEEFERDIIAYKRMGYTPVTLREVANYVKRQGDLPKKPMVITFDDGHYNNLHYALPILKKHNCKAVINIVTSFSRFSTETPNEANKPGYSYLTWDNIRELNDSGLIEIGNHTHAMHKLKPRYGIAQVSGETIDQYKDALRADLTKCNEYLTESAGVEKPTTFAYPFGKYTKEGRELLEELGFETILTCNEGTSEIRRNDAESIATLKRYNRSGNISHEKFIKKVFGQQQ